VSHWVVSRILHEQLLYPYHVQRVQGLSPADYPVRRRFCRWFLLGLDNAFDMPLNRRQEMWFLHDGAPPHYSRQVRARTDYANRACNVTCNVMLVAKLVPRTADEPSAQRTAILCPLMIDCTLFYRHRDECLHIITFAISLILEE
jgi:hypothetical protein